MHLINVYVWEVLALFVHVVSQRLVHGFWAPILLRNQISNWNHITGRAGPQPAEPISRWVPFFLFYLASLLCLFIYLSIYPYLSSTLLATTIVHPNGRGSLTHRCDASITVDASYTRTQPHPHYSTLGFSRLINDLGDLVRLGIFAAKWSRFLLFHCAWVLLRKGCQRRSFLQSFSNVRRSDGISRYLLMCTWNCRSSIKKGSPAFKVAGRLLDVKKNDVVPSMSIRMIFARDHSRSREIPLHSSFYNAPIFSDNLLHDIQAWLIGRIIGKRPS